MAIMRRIRWWINRRRFPDQAWFWTPRWQAGEREASNDIAYGRVRTFSTGEELLAWLDREDD